MNTMTANNDQPKPESLAGPGCAVAAGSEFAPLELAPTPDLGDEVISDLKRVAIADKGGVRDGISFMVELPPGVSGTEICLTNGQLKKLLDFGRWKRVPRKPNTPNVQSEPRSQQKTKGENHA